MLSAGKGLNSRGFLSGSWWSWWLSEVDIYCGWNYIELLLSYMEGIRTASRAAKGFFEEELLN